MGVDSNVYTGPYMVVKAKEVEYDNSRYTCINEECSEFNRDVDRSKKFCSKCGKEHGDRKFTDKHIPRISEAYESEEFKEKFGDDYWFDDMCTCVESASGDRRVYALSVKDNREHGYGFGWKYYGDGTGEVKPEDITNELAIAEKEYKDKIEWIRNIDGIVSVEVKWGILTYYS
jgi:hypothetical protein